MVRKHLIFAILALALLIAVARPIISTPALVHTTAAHVVLMNSDDGQDDLTPTPTPTPTQPGWGTDCTGCAGGGPN